MKKTAIIFTAALIISLLAASCGKTTAYKALIVTGQGQYDWQSSSGNIKKILDQTGLFTTTIQTTPPKGSDMSSFTPEFKRFNVVVIDYNGDEWPERTRKAFMDYVANGGGAVISQSAGSAFPEWREYGEICGSREPADYCGNPHEFEVRMKESQNPVVKDLPARWVHTSDYLPCRLIGPSFKTEVLATAWSDTTGGGSGKNEPVLMATRYGKGRVFHTTLGLAKNENDTAMKCSGFITTLQRGAEWAACDSVTQKVPFDFPSAAEPVIRPDFRQLTLEQDFIGIAKYRIDRSTRYITDIQGWIREAHGNAVELQKIEKMMIALINDSNATDEGKVLILHELSWMGSELCIPAVKEMALKPELKDAAEFALERLKVK